MDFKINKFNNMINAGLTVDEVNGSYWAVDAIIQKNEKMGFTNAWKRIEETTNLLNALNTFLIFIISDLVVNGKIKIGLFDIPKLWKEAKKLIEAILDIFRFDVFKRLAFQPLGIGEVIENYLVWCFQNIITKDNKVKVPLLKIIPFIVKTFEFVRALVAHFKKKNLIPDLSTVV